MRMAEKFRRPIVVFVDTPAAYPGVESEERGVAEAIAFNLREMSVLKVPVVVVITGEGGSGGALGIAIGDRILMQEYAIYSVIPPEGCAAILWRDSGKKVEAATALKLTAADLLARGIVDEIVREPIGGSHTSFDEAATLLDGPLRAALESASAPDIEARLARRYDKFRDMGRLGADFTDERERVTLQILRLSHRKDAKTPRIRSCSRFASRLASSCGTLKFSSRPSALVQELEI